MTNNDQILVVTEEKKRRRGLLWVAAGAVALLAGGSTFALWSASDTFSGGTITAGDLNIAQLHDTSFWDVSNDRADATEIVGATDGSQLGHKIDDVTTWRVAPGDKMAASFETTVTLDGDNLVARLGLDGLQDLESNISGMNYSYEVYYGDKLLVTETALPTSADAPLMYLAATTNGQAAGLDDATNGILGSTAAAVDGVAAQKAVFGMPTTSEKFNVVIYASFYKDLDGDFRYQPTDTTVTDRIDVNLADTLGTLTLKLSQVRDAGQQFS
ncbi:alternate-type signal peptide domain-containing protein [Microbacterium sp. SORGH_AS_0888]|uniref:alternate-type signal peptide domain-containing protein n=1 Tax=Microbacterium sp. SORGH_AS_0888 TaxID=3041791 RepID=UPI002780BB8F|nr:alternate-type signal peptide domain-containing protein [Microbacterium sp. SORGH_AS_0888]MDQ1130274.1 alternate signal-mediated exported protein [Microbacterium sp. SORGH_AS_0888]